MSDITIEPRDGFTFTVEIVPDDDGHGPVSDWRRKGYSDRIAKAPGELLLTDNNPSGLRGTTCARFYDYQEACKIARRDGWGVSPYSVSKSRHVNGIWALTGHWFDDHRNLQSFTAYADDLNLAYRDIYKQHRAQYTARQYAAMAARQDFKRLRDWCNGDWHYCGVVVTASRNGIKLGNASLWGIESDCGDYLETVAQELAEEALAEAREILTDLCDCDGEDSE